MLTLIAIGLLATQGAAAQSAATPTSAVTALQLKISADEDLRPRVKKAMEAAIGATAGLRLVETAPDVTVSVIVLKVVNRSRRDVGVVFSVLVTSPLLKSMAVDLKDLGEKGDQWKTTLEEGVKHVAHWVQTSSVEDLAATCRSIVEALTKELQSLKARDKSGLLDTGPWE